MPPPLLARHHRTRLLEVWRSAGWPCQDGVEIDLLAAGLLERCTDECGRTLLRLTDAGIAHLAEARRAGKRSESLHDRMALAFARQQLLPAGRVVWRELSLRAALEAEEEPPCAAEGAAPAAPPAAQPLPALWGDDAPTPAARRAARLWRVARPDLFSIRHTTVPGYLRPMVHEVKASRADLQSDLRHAAKRNAYQWLCEECYYVFPAGIAAPDEVPAQFGVWLMHGAPGEDGLGARFELVRAARNARCTLPFDVWMALCRATPLAGAPEPAQGRLGAP
ncbi:hypothetical protein [Pulveribacter sp.]|uniref:hypothetical protein n=1 Tax=Pulveribacter sp. TaxID=2678893 RepID=UPI0028A20444|nr:hypothetical protein [Pulveribacter sp.]